MKTIDYRDLEVSEAMKMLLDSAGSVVGTRAAQGGYPRTDRQYLQSKREELARACYDILYGQHSHRHPCELTPLIQQYSLGCENEKPLSKRQRRTATGCLLTRVK